MNIPNWKVTKEVLKKYNHEEYIYYQSNIPTKINPKDIFALSRKYSDIHNDRNMNVLKKNVAQDGWNNRFFKTVRLYKLPNGKLMVEEGNHRAIFATMSNMEEIAANLIFIIPKSNISYGTVKRIDNLEQKEDRYDSLYWKLRERKGNQKEKLAFRNKIGNKCEKIKQKKYKIIQSVVIEQGLIKNKKRK